MTGQAISRILLSTVLVAVFTGCKAFRDETTSYDVGPRVGFHVDAGAQDMGTGTNQSGAPVYGESAMGWSTVLLEFGWGLQAGPVTFEPEFYLGGGGGKIDNGRWLGIAEGELDSWDGTAVGCGSRLRFTIDSESHFRMGFDWKYLRYEGTCNSIADGLPGLTLRQDAVTDHLELLAVVDYDGEHFRPYLATGVVSNFNEFTQVSNPANKIEIETREPFGAKLGLDVHRIGDTGFYSTLELGYFGGVAFGLGVGYRF